MIIMKPSTLLFNLVKQSDNKAQLTRHLGHNVNRGKVFPTEVLAVIGRKSSIGDFFFSPVIVGYGLNQFRDGALEST